MTAEEIMGLIEKCDTREMQSNKMLMERGEHINDAVVMNNGLEDRVSKLMKQSDQLDGIKNKSDQNVVEIVDELINRMQIFVVFKGTYKK